MALKRHAPRTPVAPAISQSDFLSSTELLCLTESYLRECAATVTAVSGNKVVLDKTVFYPAGGGQPCDYGKIVLQKRAAENENAGGRPQAEFAVSEVRKESGQVFHSVEGEGGLQAGDGVRCAIDWQRRYSLMRMHTAAHTLGSLMYKQGWLITGNQLGVEESRFDFSMENFDRQKFEEVVAQANLELAKNVELKIYELPREEALKIPEVVKLAGALPPSIPILRIVEIPGVDLQADGGTHVRNTKEVGRIEITSLENKGAKNKRVYFRLSAPQ